jgi:hypothetical protein
MLVSFHVEQQTVMDSKSVETREPAEFVFVDAVRVCRKSLTNFTVEIHRPVGWVAQSV